MRELNECTAEVFRRGEQRIRERRRRRVLAVCVLAVCVPVCLIAAVWPPVNLPAMGQSGESRPEYLTGEDAEYAPGSFAGSLVAVEIRADGAASERCEEVTDSLAVAAMFRAVDRLFVYADWGDRQDNGNLPAEEANGNLDLSVSAGPWKALTITFTAEDGSRAVYRLSGNVLVNVSADEAVSLSEAQVAELAAVLGLAE